MIDSAVPIVHGAGFVRHRAERKIVGGDASRRSQRDSSLISVSSGQDAPLACVSSSLSSATVSVARHLQQAGGAMTSHFLRLCRWSISYHTALVVLTELEGVRMLKPAKKYYARLLADVGLRSKRVDIGAVAQ